MQRNVKFIYNSIELEQYSFHATKAQHTGQKKMKYPIYNNRELVGYASTAKQAVSIIKKSLNVHSSMTIEVWLRSDDMCEILSLPKGFVYSVFYSY